MQTDETQITVTRSVPLTWLLGLVGIVAAQAVTLYFDLRDLRVAFVEYKTTVQSINSTLSLSTVRAAEQEQRINDHARRLQELEFEVRGLNRKSSQ